MPCMPHKNNAETEEHNVSPHRSARAALKLLKDTPSWQPVTQGQRRGSGWT